MTDSNRVIIFDTTLRDGEQSPGASMTIDQKVRVAHMLERLQVDVIEAGFPVASRRDFEAVKTIANTIKGPTICALARARAGDIERAWEAVRGAAKRPRIHTFIATSPLHMKHKLNMSHEQVLEAITRSVRYAHSLGADVQWSAEDATRSDINFLAQCVQAAIEAGATTINIPDTVGYELPIKGGFADLIRTLRATVPGAHTVTFAVHCHNDLGLATANSLAGVYGGARQVECTVNGVGERAGNAALEEVVMMLKVHQSRLSYITGVRTEFITHTSRLVSAITGFVVQPNKAIVGDNALSHGSGIHQDGILKKRESYEIIDPRTIGAEGSTLVLTRHSGRAALRHAYRELGYDLDDATFGLVCSRFENIAGVKKEVTEDDLIEILEDRKAAARGPYEVLTCHSEIDAEDGNRNGYARLTMRIHGIDRRPVESYSKDGEIDACLRCIRHAVDIKARLVDFRVQAIGEGTDAQAKVWVTLEYLHVRKHGTATDTSTSIAAVKAYVNTLNTLARADNLASPMEHSRTARA